VPVKGEGVTTHEGGSMGWCIIKKTASKKTKGKKEPVEGRGWALGTSGKKKGGRMGKKKSLQQKRSEKPG